MHLTRTGPLPPRLDARLGALLGIVLLTLTACGRSTAVATNDTAHYVALGDSYTSGPGIQPFVDRGCQRSGADYPSLVARELKITDFRDVSCGGAMTTNLVTAQAVAGQPAPQLQAVGSNTTLVTIGMGLNDFALSYGLLYACASKGTPTQGCAQVLAMSDAQVSQRIEAAARRVNASLQAIAEKAPKARIVLVGYPRIVPDSGSCPDRLPMPAAALARVRRAVVEINDLWKKAATATGADYVDMYDASEGHDICSSDPWVNGITDEPGKAAALHPFAAYHRAVAQKIVTLIKK
jgi:hypothetical protein